VDDAFEALITLTNRQYNSIQGISHNLPILPPAPNDAKAWVETAGQTEPQSAGQQLRRQRRRANPQAAQGRPRADPRRRGEIRKRRQRRLGLQQPECLPQPYGGNVEQTSVGLQLNIPIYSGGLTSSQVRQSYAQLDQSEQQRESCAGRWSKTPATCTAR
jgi:outer membrane protein